MSSLSDPETRHEMLRESAQERRLLDQLIPIAVVILGIHGLIAYLLNISALRALSYLLLTTPLPLAYSAPEIASRVTVTLHYQDGARITRPVTRHDFMKIKGPLQRRTALIYIFTRPAALGERLVSPALDHLFCEPGVLLSELELHREVSLTSISWEVRYLRAQEGEMTSTSASTPPQYARYLCESRQLELSRARLSHKHPLQRLPTTRGAEGLK